MGGEDNMGAGQAETPEAVLGTVEIDGQEHSGAEDGGAGYTRTFTDAKAAPVASKKKSSAAGEENLEKRINKLKGRLTRAGIKVRQSQTGYGSTLGTTDEDINSQIKSIGYEGLAERYKDSPLIKNSIDVVVYIIRYFGLMSQPEAVVKQDAKKLNAIRDQFNIVMDRNENTIVDYEVKWFDRQQQYIEATQSINEADEVIALAKTERQTVMEMLGKVGSMGDSEINSELKGRVNATELRKLTNATPEDRRDYLNQVLRYELRKVSMQISESDKYLDDSFFKVKECERNLDCIAENIEKAKTEAVKIRLFYVRELEEIMTQPEVHLDTMENIESAYSLLETMQARGAVLKERTQKLQLAMKKRYDRISGLSTGRDGTGKQRVQFKEPDLHTDEYQKVMEERDRFRNEVKEGIETRRYNMPPM